MLLWDNPIKTQNSFYTLEILKSNFSFNSALNSGGVLYLTNGYITIESCIFHDNEADIGGVIYFHQDCKIFYNSSHLFQIIIIVSSNSSNLIIQNSIFFNNNALKEGGAIKITGMIVISKNCTYINNTAPYGNNIAAFPFKITLDSKSVISNVSKKEPINFFIDNEVTGSVINQSFYFKIIDFYNQTVSNLQNFIVHVSLLNFNKSNSPVKSYNFVGNKLIVIKDGLFSYDNVAFYSNPPDSILSLSFSSDIISNVYLMNQQEGFLKDFQEIQDELRPKISQDIGDFNDNNTIYYLVDVDLRQCINGEIYNEVSQSCVLCPFKTFSFNSSDLNCRDCPENAFCSGGKNVTVNKGFWRSSNLSLTIHECTPFPFSCL